MNVGQTAPERSVGISNEAEEFMEAEPLKTVEHCRKEKISRIKRFFLARAQVTQAALGSWRGYLELWAANCPLLGEFVFCEGDLIADIFKQIGK